ncbi:MAG TPA: GAF domain-containing protein [Candidatus Binatia bacterium]|nr:GAF domain-containing protein [Candidatus Binatia bacterium]
MRNRLRAVTQATLGQLGFSTGVLFIADEQDGHLQPVLAIGHAPHEIDGDAWEPALREATGEGSTPGDSPSEVDWLPAAFNPARLFVLREEGQPVGVLLGTCGLNRLDAELSVERADEICEQLSLLVYANFLKGQSERRLRQLQLISQVNQRIMPLITDDRKLEMVAQIVCDTFDFYHTSILLVDPHRRELLLHVTAGEAAETLTDGDMSFLAEGKGLAAWVVDSGEPVLVNDVDDEQRYQHVPILPDTKSEAVVPIKARGTTIGVLDVQSEKRNAFDFVDLLALQIVANQVAGALENNRLLQEERRRRRMIQTLQETVRVITSSLELDRVLDLILRELGRVISYDNVRLKRVEDDVAKVIAARGFKDLDRVMGTTYRVSENTLAALIVYERQTVNIADITNDPRWLWLPGTKKIRSWIGVPLLFKDRVVGLLSVSRLEVDPFSDDEAEMVNAFANQAAIAIENARLYNELREFSATLEERVRKRTRELERAREELADVLSREVEVQENERIRIANELHDSVIQAMIAVNFQLQSVKLSLLNDREPAASQLSAVQQMLDALVAEIKAVVHDLRPPALESLGLVHAVRQLAGQFDDPPTFAVQLQVLGNVRPLSSGTERTIYRVVQEALSNSRVHSGARQFKLAMIFEAAQLCVILQDDGRGFDPDGEEGKGLGLLTMHDRAHSSGGTLSIDSGVDRGTRIELIVPVHNKEPIREQA